jgi:hypothetical protein
MSDQEHASQMAVENEALRHIIGALRTVLDWKPKGADFSRKLSSLRFTAQSFQRHVERLMALKEQGGYLTDAVEQKPNLNEAVQALLKEHDEIEESLHRIVYRLDHVNPADKAGMDAVCNDLEMLLLQVEDHHRREARLMQEAYLRDVGEPG